MSQIQQLEQMLAMTKVQAFDLQSRLERSHQQELGQLHQEAKYHWESCCIVASLLGFADMNSLTPDKFRELVQEKLQPKPEEQAHE